MLEEQKNSLLNELKNSQSNQSEEEQYIVKERDKRFKEYNKLVIIFMLLFGFVLSFAFEYLKYVNLIWSTTNLSEDKIFMEEFKARKNQYLSRIWLTDSQAETQTLTVNFNVSSWSVINDTVVWFVSNNDVPYAEKKEQVESFLSNFSKELKTNDELIEKINTNIWKYWFLPQELDDLLSDSSIQRSILSVEAIKFYTAMDIFSRLPSFRDSLATAVWEKVDTIKANLNYFIKRWETDVEKYLKYCYLNPYETSWECLVSKDFDQYYATQKLGDNKNAYKNFNVYLFKEVINYLEQKLEYEKPSKLSIIMNSLDPIKNSIQFTVWINTLKEDENLLYQEWITSPHIQMVSVFLSLLRKSYLILWSETSLKDISINEVKETVWTQEISFNSSKFEFNVPVQKSVEREIYDYIYK